ncbi:TetR/AcrR family transcriptional regulator [Mycobacterium sp. CVI_P3]|uniref:TetR/AcrR family transcriptional regulator n=1 Tax=Mycobacterium pinniadriaticum TaxID=2994102 RepID=A0ABT3SBH8_9MYCO|nr:TetR/AcrR family transcriptional regulator [Mycobacterium pinniadriaticum]MCX2930119.1 TetR/AcrR family transcriptional regulator [Mycobacterium pinniadriaticum]MCX2936232.1 TetR/AcrR family transcriptional regulator [Mycobacterium pinniadriaticum]
MSTNSDDSRTSRSRGRPRLEIDRDAVADAVAELFVEGGIDAVSIAETAERLSVSRATLYRTVPTKEDLLGILFERSTRELTERTDAVLDATSGPGEQLIELIKLQAEAAIQMRSYMPVFFGGGGLPPDVFMRWRKWSRQFEKRWSGVVAACMDAGCLEKTDPVVATRLILGMIIWVSRWYRPSEKITADEIADSAITLLRLRLPKV